MSKILLSDEVIKILFTNKWIRSVNKKLINYTDEFKIHFITGFYKGKVAIYILNEVGLDLDTLGRNR